MKEALKLLEIAAKVENNVVEFIKSSKFKVEITNISQGKDEGEVSRENFTEMDSNSTFLPQDDLA